MNDEERTEVLAEILRERMPSVRYIIDEWSVPDADALNYAQIKDLIWQIAAPLGLSMLGFSLAEGAHRDDPGNLDIAEARALFARTGEETGTLLDRFLGVAGQLRG